MSGYLSFSYTGNPLIDAILSALEDAGTAYHSTAQWDEPMHDGRTCIEAIQQAANDAASALGVIAPRNESSGVSPGGGEEVPAGFYTMDQVRFERWRNECPNGTVEEAHAAGYRLGAAVGRRAEQMKAQLGLTPAPQDSVRVGDGMREMAANTGTLAVAAFLTGEITTPAPAAGADGEESP